jgi:hypothetical protein
MGAKCREDHTVWPINDSCNIWKVHEGTQLMTKIKVTHILARIFLYEVHSDLDCKEEDYVGIKIVVKFL